ncbi:MULTISPECIES: hypothetical protein [Clostridium]|uniref:SipL SPOCS domain-containing protein n=2 Tax=Clostridium TaxID=1485 RepID=D8GI82_CLOLD|nr:MULTISPECIES: hypothetical protein [Clostridium]ADK14944.1 hypothetical protein CLJU_c18820 [Clostridium ljungdahlii DSM 13528]OAA87939.1 hypothetical protein WX45_03423 [Clostridium ljungdahlii DSM 13528]OAA94038.1 hypothetical protein WX73_03608 [Clostridium coskatii]OBR96600.1 hypothetical protein CLCOS_07620 [Clostridium coskatii]
MRKSKFKNKKYLTSSNAEKNQHNKYCVKTKQKDTSKNKIKVRKNSELHKEKLKVNVKMKTDETKSTDLKSNMCKSKMIVECNSNIVKPFVNNGLFPVRLPVIISESAIRINIENTVSFSKPVAYIKSIRRTAFITQCSLIPDMGKLFLSGIVKKSIEYSESMVDNTDLNGQIKNIVIKVPFDCVTKIKYIVNPLMFEKNYKNKSALANAQNCEQIFYESYNEPSKISCDLIHASFEEINIKDIQSTYNNFNGKTFFKTISQKMAMILTIRLTQNQNVYVASRINCEQ